MPTTFAGMLLTIRLLDRGPMAKATMTTKGQVTIPAAVRAALGAERGDRMEFVQIGPGLFAVFAATESVTALKGLVRKPKTPVSIENMNVAIAAHGASAN